MPVWQKVQFRVQPTWDETHRAPARPTSGMKTVSISIPGAVRISHFRVPSFDTWRSTISGRARVKASASFACMSFATLVIAAKSVTP